MIAVGTFELILLDLDGVLIDSRPAMEHAWRRVQDDHGVDLPFSTYFAQIGRPFDDIMTRMGLADRMPGIADSYEAGATEAVDLARPYPGVVHALAECSRRGTTLGIVTSKDSQRTAVILDRLGASFDTVRAPQVGVRGKPAPGLLMLAMVDAGVDPADTLFVGDMQVDLEAARRAGVSFVHAAWGYGRVPAGCASITSARQLVRFASRRRRFAEPALSAGATART